MEQDIYHRDTSEQYEHYYARYWGYSTRVCNAGIAHVLLQHFTYMSLVEDLKAT